MRILKDRNNGDQRGSQKRHSFLKCFLRTDNLGCNNLDGKCCLSWGGGEFAIKKEKQTSRKVRKSGKKKDHLICQPEKKKATAGKSEGMNNHIQQRCLFSNKGMISTVYKSLVFG